MAFYLTTSIITVDQRYMPEMIPDYYYRKRGHIMAFVKKTWKNRIAEYINRRLLTNEDGSTNLVTVARDEGTISQEGDAFNAANMNDLEDRIESEFNEINQSLMNNDLIQLKDLSASTTDTTLTDKLSNYEYIIICSYTGYNVYDFTIIPHKYLLDFPESIINVKDNAIKILSDKRVSFKKGSTLNAKIFGYKNII